MGIERNPDILFWSRAKSRAAPYVRNCSGMQLILPNPTTLAIPATAGLVHFDITLRSPRKYGVAAECKSAGRRDCARGEAG